jgi:hypothetical protein
MMYFLLLVQYTSQLHASISQFESKISTATGLASRKQGAVGLVRRYNIYYIYALTIGSRSGHRRNGTRTTAEHPIARAGQWRGKYASNYRVSIYV